MVKKIYGVNAEGEKVELNFKEFLVITENDSELQIDLAVEQHPEKPDLALNICSGPLVEIPGGDGDTRMFKAVEGARYFSILPGAYNLVLIKIIRAEPMAG
jgi:hypothetical protein